MYDIPLLTAKSNKFGILLRSVSQYYDSPIDMYFKSNCNFEDILSFKVINLDAQMVCLEFKFPAIRKREFRA